MDHHKFPDDFPKRKPFIVEDRPGIPLIPQKGNQIPRMFRVWLIPWIIMTVNLGKVALTTGSIMNMHGIKIGGILCTDIVKADRTIVR